MSAARAQQHVARPFNSFFYFRKDDKARRLARLWFPHLRETQRLATLWKILSEEEKDYWKVEARAAGARHKIEHPDYRFQPRRRHQNAEGPYHSHPGIIQFRMSMLPGGSPNVPTASAFPRPPSPPGLLYEASPSIAPPVNDYFQSIEYRAKILRGGTLAVQAPGIFPRVWSPTGFQREVSPSISQPSSLNPAQYLDVSQVSQCAPQTTTSQWITPADENNVIYDSHFSVPPASTSGTDNRWLYPSSPPSSREDPAASNYRWPLGIQPSDYPAVGDLEEFFSSVLPPSMRGPQCSFLPPNP